MPDVMPFSAFLQDARARPLGPRLLGHAASLALHGPPLALFVAAWLTRALVLDHALDLPEFRATPRLVYYQVPAHLVDGLPAGASGGAATTGTLAGEQGARRGKAGASKRRSRRPLVFHRLHKRAAHGPLPEKVAEIGPDESGDAHHPGNGLGHHDNGSADHGDGDGAGTASGGAGDSAHTLGAKRGLATEGDGAASDGTAAVDARLGLWVPPKLERKDPGRGGPARDHAAGSDGEGPLDDGEDDVGMVGAPLPGRPMRVSMNFAAYLRTFDPVPSLPESAWPPGRNTNSVLLEICVSERGEVADVIVRQSAGPDVDQSLLGVIRTWRYRPRVVRGTAQPFCHPIRLVYTRMQRFDRRW